MKSEISHIRNHYSKSELIESALAENPVNQFATWFEDVLNSGNPEPTAMVLSTVNEFGKPSSRFVLLKDFSESGFTFFTNYKSRKATDIQSNPNVSLVFFWHELERQVRIEGVAEKLDAATSDEYFYSRPIGSRIGAWASPQSQVVETREILEKELKLFENQFNGEDIPRPENWGGYLIKPEIIEFWQGRENRLHDRLRYSKVGNEWKIERLAP